MQKKMIISISDKKVRIAVYEAYKRKCFYTGRDIKFDEMVIDHLIPKSKGGEDSFDNYVLTFADLNLGKSNKLDEDVLRMQWPVKNIYGPRAFAIYHKSCIKANKAPKHNESLSKKISEFDIPQRNFKSNYRKPNKTRLIIKKDLVWVEDESIEIFTTLSDANDINKFEVLNDLDLFYNLAMDNEENYCFDIWLPTKRKTSIQSIWYMIDNQYFRVIDHVEYYHKHDDEPWAYVYFSNDFLKFIEWSGSISECLEGILDQEEDIDKHEKLLTFCDLYPPGERYADQIKNQ